MTRLKPLSLLLWKALKAGFTDIRKHPSHYLIGVALGLALALIVKHFR